MSVDHLRTDGMSADVIFLETYMMYAALLVSGAPIPLSDPASFDDYFIGQHQHKAALTLKSPEVRTWIEFGESNDASSRREFALVSCQVRTVDGARIVGHSRAAQEECGIVQTRIEKIGCTGQHQWMAAGPRSGYHVDSLTRGT
jgi:hypothetical protein